MLPSADLTVAGAGVFWPARGAPLAEAALAASDHRLVWVDVELLTGSRPLTARGKLATFKGMKRIDTTPARLREGALIAGS